MALSWCWRLKLLQTGLHLINFTMKKNEASVNQKLDVENKPRKKNYEKDEKRKDPRDSLYLIFFFNRVLCTSKCRTDWRRISHGKTWFDRLYYNTLEDNRGSMNRRRLIKGMLCACAELRSPARTSCGATQYMWESSTLLIWCSCRSTGSMQVVSLMWSSSTSCQ